MASWELKQFRELGGATRGLLKRAMTEYNLSARAYDRIGEAIQFRSLDRHLWGG